MNTKNLHLAALASIAALAASGTAQDYVKGEHEGGYEHFGPSQYRYHQAVGYSGHSDYTFTSDNRGKTNYVQVTMSLPRDGMYAARVFVPRLNATSRRVPVTIFGANGPITVAVDQAVLFDQWTDVLAVVPMKAGNMQRFEISDDTGEGWGAKRVGFDEVKLTYLGPIGWAPSARITGTNWINNHAFAVNVAATIGTSYTMKITVAGQERTLGGAIDRNPKSIVVDLAALGLPKFTSNALIPLRLEVSNGTIPAVARATHQVLLPVVICPGVQPFNNGAMGGDGTFRALEDSFKEWSKPNNWGGLATVPAFGLGYTMRGLELYPTLYTARYDLNEGSLVDAGNGVKQAVDDALSRTYADRVILIGHSKGGLGVRASLVYNRIAPRVKRAIMVTTPHLGCIFALEQLRYQNLTPVYGWFRQTVREPYECPNENLQLRLLNSVSMPVGPQYEMIYSLSWGATHTLLDRQLYLSTPGDYVVPGHSQRARNVNFWLGIDYGLIPAFAEASAAGLVHETQIDRSHWDIMGDRLCHEKLYDLAFRRS